MNDSPEIKKPRTYDFEDWDFFCRDVLRYHMATRPNDQLISHYIESFVQFMTSDVVKHLGGLMAPHSRYNTTEGRDAWLNRVRTVISDEDKSAELPITLGECRSQYKAKTTNVTELWTRSERLVLLQEITSEEQRTYFWESLSWKVQAELVKRCPYFDPRHDVWKGEDTAVVKEAEQSLSWTIEILECEDSIASNRNALLFVGAIIVALGMIIAMAGFGLCRYKVNVGLFISIFFLIVACSWVIIMLLVFSCSALASTKRLRRLRHKRSQASST